MYESFYHLSATPFRLTPDPAFCFSHSGYQEAYAYLQYAFELGEGLILLTGRPGAGKTTLVESFLRSLDVKRVAAARIATSDFEATDLLRAVAYDFDIDAAGLDKATLLRCIQRHFARRCRNRTARDSLSSRGGGRSFDRRRSRSCRSHWNRDTRRPPPLNRPPGAGTACQNTGQRRRRHRNSSDRKRPATSCSA